MDYLYASTPYVLLFLVNFVLVKYWTVRNLSKAVEDVAEAHALWSSYGGSYDENIQKLIEKRIYSQQLEDRALKQVTRKLESNLNLEEYSPDTMRAVAQEVVYIINQNQLRKTNE